MAFLLWCAVFGTLFFLLAAVLERLGLLEDPPPHPMPCRCVDALPCVVHPWRYDWQRDAAGEAPIDAA
jgi:hypothetical protein